MVQSSDYDVVVVGGGAAGIGAAVSAAQAGASVCLVEQYGFLGGAATNSSVLTHCGFFDQNGVQVVAGVGQQVLDQLDRRDLYQIETSATTGNTIVLLDMETTKSVYDDLVSSAGVDVLLHSTLLDATVKGDRITGVTVVHRGGRESLDAQAFVDASGDGALLAAAGADVEVAPLDERQASTLVLRIGGVREDASLTSDDLGAAVRAYSLEHDVTLPRETGIVVRMPLSREVMLLLADSHRDVFDVRELAAAEVQARQDSWHYLRAFQKSVPGWQDSYLAATGPQLGIREGRRMVGRDRVIADDVSSGRRRPEDGVARCGWPMEDHSVPGATQYSAIRGKEFYDIPYGSICSSNRSNLWGAGRLTSSDPRAYASLRVMGTSLATGHACGAAAAVWCREQAHDIEATRNLLRQQGALI